MLSNEHAGADGVRTAACARGAELTGPGPDFKAIATNFFSERMVAEIAADPEAWKAARKEAARKRKQERLAQERVRNRMPPALIDPVLALDRLDHAAVPLYRRNSVLAPNPPTP
jgi:hypothetical protein